MLKKNEKREKKVEMYLSKNAAIKKKKREGWWGRSLDTRSFVIAEFLSDVWKKSYTSGMLSKIFSVTIATGVNF